MFLAGGIGLLGMFSEFVPNPVGIFIGISSATAIALKGPALVNNIEGLIQATEQIYSNYDNANEMFSQLESINALTVDINSD